MMEPITREELFLAAAGGAFDGDLPTPVTRQEQYLYQIKSLCDSLQNDIAAVGRTAVSSWQGIQAIVRAGLASKVFSIGDQLRHQAACDR